MTSIQYPFPPFNNLVGMNFTVYIGRITFEILIFHRILSDPNIPMKHTIWKFPIQLTSEI